VRRAWLVPLLLSCVVLPGTASAAATGSGQSCPTIVDGGRFANVAALKRLVRRENRFGERYLASSAHRRTIDWIEREMRSIGGFRVRSDPFKVWTWLPRAKAKGRPGLALERAGALTVAGRGVPVAGAVRWSKPATRKGRLVHLAADQEITAANSAGKVVVREFPGTALPYAAFGIIGVYVTPDLARATGSYDRPFLNELQQELLDASAAGAAGVVFAFDVPRKQVSGYGDPHNGTIYRVPAVYVGGAEARRLRALAAEGRSARIAVRARVKRTTTRNLIATLPGRSSQRIILATNTDGQSWVQEDGVSGLIAFARYYAGLPARCRPRTLQLAFASAHDSLVNDGTNRYTKPLDAAYGRGSIAFAFAVEHLGTREILPNSAGTRLRFTGRGEPFLFGVGNSTALQDAAAAATKRRKLDMTAVLKGLGLPTPGQVPPVCSMGGLGGPFHWKLIPTLAMISGPWSLYAPAFRETALDYRRMRSQLLAAGDSVLALDGLPSAQIAGEYPAMREQRAQGAPTCPREEYPQFAPGP
jgi:hypothetical protein